MPRPPCPAVTRTACASTWCRAAVGRDDRRRHRLPEHRLDRLLRLRPPGARARGRPPPGPALTGHLGQHARTPRPRRAPGRARPRPGRVCERLLVGRAPRQRALRPVVVARSDAARRAHAPALPVPRRHRLRPRPSDRDRAQRDAHPLTTRPRSVVLVEGDQRPGRARDARRAPRRDLAAERVAVVPIGGAQAIGRFLAPSARRANLGWPASATPARSATSGARSSVRVSAPTSHAPRSSGSASSSATPTWRTS